MKVLVDTSVWSSALRREAVRVDERVRLLEKIINQGDGVIIGAIRQELLSGIRDVKQFNKLKSYLHSFPDLLLIREDYETAAEYFNYCKSKGIQGSNTDFLICSVSINHKLAILTSDNDFKNYVKHINIKLL